MLGKQKEKLSKTIETQDSSEHWDGLKDVSYVIIPVSNEVTQFQTFDYPEHWEFPVFCAILSIMLGLGLPTPCSG